MRGIGRGRVEVEKRIFLHCAAHDKTVSSFGRNDGSLVCEIPWFVKENEAGLVIALGVGHGVVAFAGLDLLAWLARDVEGAEGAVVDLGVGGGVTGEVLGAELVLDLVEGFLEFLAVVAYVDDAAAGVFGEALHVGVAGVAHAEAAIEAAVGDEDDVDDGVGFLGGLGGGLEGFLRALVAAVGEQDEDLAAGLLAELVVGGEV